jgi:hypothetical protein
MINCTRGPDILFVESLMALQSFIPDEPQRLPFIASQHKVGLSNCQLAIGAAASKEEIPLTVEQPLFDCSTRTIGTKVSDY